MKIFTKEILKKLPPLYGNENKKPEEIKVPLKLFNPSGVGTWYITEYNPDTGIAFGWCDLGCPVLGYVNLDELLSKRFKPFGLKVERDMYWDSNTTLAEVMAGKN